MTRVTASIGFNRRECGAAFAETLVILPVLLLIGLGIIQFALLYEAKATLNYATLMSARAGAVENAAPDAMRDALARGLVPLYSPSPNAAGLEAKYLETRADVAAHVDLRILNPTTEAFRDFAEVGAISGQLEIPNRHLHLREVTIGSASGVNIQDANLLKVAVLYGADLKVPFVGPLIADAVSALSSDPVKLAMLADNRLPMLGVATVRMQSEARMSDAVQSLAEVEQALAQSQGTAQSRSQPN